MDDIGRYVRTVLVVPLTFSGETPRFAGWRFAASLAHVEGQTIVRALPGESCPAEYLERGPVCDHCRSARNRNDTYVVRHEDGRTKQVGRTCLGDFLGSDAALSAARAAELSLELATIAKQGEDLESGTWGGGGFYLPTFLAVCAALMRKGGWVSAARAREHGGEPTATRAWEVMLELSRDPRAQSPAEQQDREAAEAALEWARSLEDEQTEAEQYLHNLRAIAHAMVVDTRLVGLAGSMVAAHQRATRPKVEMDAPAGHVGTVGAKVSWGLPPQLGKRGAPLKSAPTVMDSSPVTFVRKVSFETQWGWSHICIFRSQAGHTLVWRTSSPGLTDNDAGKAVTLVGTVKGHTDYQGRPQTDLTRCVASVLREKASA
jgi:hypothetical protein